MSESPVSEMLLKAGALQRAILDSATFSSIATDALGVIQLFNVGAERMLGYAPNEVIDRITPANLSDPEELLARAATLSAEYGTQIAPGFESMVFRAARGIEDIYELTYIRKDGSRLSAVVSVTALRDANENIIGYLLIGSDNTARKLVEEERQRLEQRLRDQQFYTRSLIESNVDALITTDPAGVITDVNKQTELLTGCTREELIGARFMDYFTDPVHAQEAIDRVLLDGVVRNYELTARSRYGALTVVSYNATTFHDREGRLQGVFAAARDVTELKQYEAVLRFKNTELENANRMKSEFLANMSHELRTPLNAIIGFSEVLRDGLVGPMSDTQRGFISDIFGSGKHLLALINDILDLTKVESGKMTLDLEPVELTSLFANSLAIIREKAAARNIRLTTDIAPDLGSTQLDARKAKQILYNLLSNAVKFTAAGGEVTLRARRVSRAEAGQQFSTRPSRSLSTICTDADELLEISVMDNGIGISSENLLHLFAPFSQIDGGLARRFEGTGLGLVMVKLLAELHGGVVAVESEVGTGSCFTAWLPMHVVDGPTATVSALPIVAKGTEVGPGARTALIVEDDPKSADLVRVQLESEGFAVLHAVSAEDALKLAEMQPLALITLDIMLPNMDGWEFLGRIKQIASLRRVPVVIISVLADRSKGYALGATAVLEKPISRKVLYESLSDIGLLPVSPFGRPRVLVVDDDPMAVELIAVRISSLAKEVLRAHGGREAIEIARRELPDLIVLDLMMPDVNGFDVVEALHEQQATSRIPIVVVTAKRVTDADRAKLQGQTSAIMEKVEFDRDRFIGEVRRAMSGRPVIG